MFNFLSSAGGLEPFTRCFVVVLYWFGLVLVLGTGLAKYGFGHDGEFVKGNVYVVFCSHMHQHWQKVNPFFYCHWYNVRMKPTKWNNDLALKRLGWPQPPVWLSLYSTFPSPGLGFAGLHYNHISYYTEFTIYFMRSCASSSCHPAFGHIKVSPTKSWFTDSTIKQGICTQI